MGVRDVSVMDQIDSSPAREGRTWQDVVTSYILSYMMPKYTIVVSNNK